MNIHRSIRKLTKEFYPAGSYGFRERHILRKVLYKEMLAYHDEHPDCTLSEIREHFQAEEFPISSGQIPFYQRKIFVICIFIALFVLIAVCVTLYRIADTWEPPVYYV